MTKEEIDIKSTERGIRLLGVLTQCQVSLTEQQARLVTVQGQLIFLDGMDCGITETKKQFSSLMKGGEKLNG
jgi:hypothetical protein